MKIKEYGIPIAIGLATDMLIFALVFFVGGLSSLSQILGYVSPLVVGMSAVVVSKLNRDEGIRTCALYGFVTGVLLTGMVLATNITIRNLVSSAGTMGMALFIVVAIASQIIKSVIAGTIATVITLHITKGKTS